VRIYFFIIITSILHRIMTNYRSRIYYISHPCAISMLSDRLARITA